MKLSFVTTTLRGRSLALVALALSAMVGTTAAHATVTDISTTPSPSGSYSLPTADLANWTNGSTGYNFVFSNAGTPIADGLVMDGATSGTNFLALDADYPTQGASTNAVTTQISGLNTGEVVTLTFGFAGSQQLTGSDGCGTCQGNFDADLAVTLGGAAPTSGGALLNAATGTGVITGNLTNNCPNQSGVTPCISSQSWSGWESESLTFTVGAGCSNCSETLSFLASDPNQKSGTQDPAFALVDSVVLTTPTAPTPEPGSLMLLSTGLLGVGGLLRSRFKKSETAA